MNSRWRGAFCFLMLFGLVYLSGCSSQSPQQSGTLSAEKLIKTNDILFTALGLVGTPYVYGGNTPDSGFDCSGLIQYVYRHSADFALPRTVAEMNRINAPNIDEDKLQSGDIIIFATSSGSRPSHAGIYVGDGRFVHAPRSGGVVRMDFLSDGYWQSSYLNAKRPLADR